LGGYLHKIKYKLFKRAKVNVTITTKVQNSDGLPPSQPEVK